MRRLTPLGTVLILGALAATLSRWADYDLFWHLASGRFQHLTGRVPSPDPFSWSAAGQPYLAYAAHIDRLLYWLWAQGGDAWVGASATLLFGLVLLPYVLLSGRLGLHPRLEAPALLVLILTVAPFAGARPHLVGAAICGLLVILLEQPFGWRRAVLVGALLGAWTHLHGSFPVGFIVVGAAGIAWGMQRAWWAAGRVAAALAVGFGVSLLTPYGLELWLGPIGSVSSTFLATFNLDWRSLQPLTLTGGAMGLLLLGLLALGTGRPQPRTVAALLLTLPAIQTARIGLFAGPLLWIVLLERVAVRWPAVHLPDAHPVHVPRIARYITAGAWVLLIAGTSALLPRVTPSAELGGLNARGPMPVAATDRLLACGEPASVWNDYNWGGYLLWRGEGRYTVGMDGRAEGLYTETQLVRYLKVHAAQDGWQSIVQESPARYALVPVSGPAIDRLPGWRRVYADDVAVLSIREGAPWRCSEQLAAAGR